MKRRLVNGVWRGRITCYPGTVRFWYEIRERKPTRHIAPPAPTAPTVPPYTSSWMLYLYDDIAYLTFDGRLAATATVTTAVQRARIEGVYARLTVVHDAQGGPTTP